MAILIEANCKEEQWQPELQCDECKCIFMYSSYPNFPQYPHFCPNCGVAFTKIKHEITSIKIDELNQ